MNYKAKRCPLCREWHQIDYREECYEEQSRRIRAMEEDIAWLVRELRKLKARTKKRKGKYDDYEDEEEY